jgi:predicted Fe-Mo cluster-binding NifX family protein
VKILLTLDGSDVAPRFDVATEVLIVTLDDDRTVADEHTLVLPKPSAEDLCQMVLRERVDVVVCGGIEDQFYEYMTWKRIQVIDSVMGPWSRVLRELRADTLESGAVLFDAPERSERGR